MGFQDLEPYGDPATDVITDLIWGPQVSLPGKNRNYEKLSGHLVEMKLQLVNLGAYVTDGFDLTILRNELDGRAITGLFTNNSFDPYGEVVVPTGVELFLSIPSGAATGNLYDTADGAVDFQIATLQVWENSAQVAGGWTAGADDIAWVMATVQ